MYSTWPFELTTKQWANFEVTMVNFVLTNSPLTVNHERILGVALVLTFPRNMDHDLLSSIWTKMRDNQLHIWKFYLVDNNITRQAADVEAAIFGTNSVCCHFSQKIHLHMKSNTNCSKPFDQWWFVLFLIVLLWLLTYDHKDHFSSHQHHYTFLGKTASLH